MTVKQVMCVLVMGVSGAVGAQAQAGAAASQAATAATTMVAPAKSFDAMLSGLEGEMMGLVRAMPAEKYNFVPSQALFAAGQKTEFTGVRSFGFMVGHVAQANYYYGGQIGGMKPDVDVETIGKLTDKDALVTALAQSFAFVHKAMGTLTEANAFEAIKTGPTTRATAAGGLVAHGFDHYGQMVEYLRMNGMVPPASQK